MAPSHTGIDLIRVTDVTGCILSFDILAKPINRVGLLTLRTPILGHISPQNYSEYKKRVYTFQSKFV